MMTTKGKRKGELFPSSSNKLTLILLVASSKTSCPSPFPFFIFVLWDPFISRRRSFQKVEPHALRRCLYYNSHSRLIKLPSTALNRLSRPTFAVCAAKKKYERTEREREMKVFVTRSFDVESYTISWTMVIVRFLHLHQCSNLWRRWCFADPTCWFLVILYESRFVFLSWLLVCRFMPPIKLLGGENEL